MLILIVGAVEIGTNYEAIAIHFWAGGDGLCEILWEVPFLDTLSSSNNFDARKDLIVALDLLTLLWANLCCYLFEVHFGVMQVWTIWRIFVSSCNLKHCLMTCELWCLHMIWSTVWQILMSLYDLKHCLANFAFFVSSYDLEHDLTWLLFTLA